MTIRVALAGNPNTGKTTLFNALTGSVQHVGNWPGVTVEKKEARLRYNKDVIVEDLPGIYSLSPYTTEEIVARTYIINDRPDVILNIVDASNLERNLYLTTQLVEVGVPVLLALNMMDVVKRNGDTIDMKKLGDELGCEVFPISALKGEGIKAAALRAVELAKEKKPHVSHHTYTPELEGKLDEIGALIADKADKDGMRWYTTKVFERDEQIMKALDLDAATKSKIDTIVTDCETQEDDDSEGIITNARYEYIAKLIELCLVKKNKNGLTVSDRVDQIVTNRILALPIFVCIIFLVYYLSISTIGTAGTDWINDHLFGDIIPGIVDPALTNIGLSAWLHSLIMDGIIAGVGAVLGFLPQMLVLFICLAILEDCGYMARIAFILDRIFRKFGLSGKSFIPVLVSTGCGIPGIMSSRTIESDNDRRLTVLSATFMPCGAKLPIIALITGALFPHSTWVAPSAYFLGMVSIVVSGIILKKTKLFAGDPTPFVIELPAYHIPSPLNVVRTMIDRALAFVKKAGTVILLATVIVWFLSGFDWHLAMVDDISNSILASIGKVIGHIFVPLGFGDWKATVASITGLMAKENLVGTFGILYGFTGVDGDDSVAIWQTLHNTYTPLAGYSLMVFNLLCVPCMAAVGAMRREMMSAKYSWFAVIYQCVFAYAVCLMIYRIGLWVSTGAFGPATVAAIIVALIFIYLLFFKKPATPEKKDPLAVVEAIEQAAGAKKSAK